MVVNSFDSAATPRAVKLIILLLTMQLLSRGTDYITGNPVSGVGVFEVTEYTPPLMWGTCCIMTSLILMVGMGLRSHRIVRFGSLVAACLYATFAIVVCDDIFSDPWDDWRFFTDYVAKAAIWGVIWWSLNIRIAVLDHRKERDSGTGRTS